MAGLLLGTLQEETPEPFAVFSDYTSAVAQVVTFFAFGALIVASGFDASGWALVGMILFAFLVARPLAVLLASARGDLALKQRAFIAWFGPKGVASMLFALIVLDSKAPHAGLVFQVAAFVVLASICSHGLTDTIAARWISEPVSEEQVAAEERGEDALEGAPRG